MQDTITKIGGSIIQHGKASDRIYLMKLNPSDMPQLVTELEKLALKEGYGKIFIKVASEDKQAFSNNGFVQEAYIPSFYGGQASAVFMAKYYNAERSTEKDAELYENVLKSSKEKKITLPPTLKTGFVCRKAEAKDAQSMVQLYRKVFETYPFPIYEENYLQKTMADNIIYFGIWHNDMLVALASSETDQKNLNAEMTDFAVAEAYRGENFALVLLANMEQEMQEHGLKTLYTIARAGSYGMNSCFAKMGYTYTGRLKNNTGISGAIESMNVWYKHI